MVVSLGETRYHTTRSIVYILGDPNPTARCFLSMPRAKGQLIVLDVYIYIKSTGTTSSIHERYAGEIMFPCPGESPSPSPSAFCSSSPSISLHSVGTGGTDEPTGRYPFMFSVFASRKSFCYRYCWWRWAKKERKNNSAGKPNTPPF